MSSNKITIDEVDGKMNIITVDVETTMADSCLKRSASNPYCEANRVVAFGAKPMGQASVMTYHNKGDSLLLHKVDEVKSFIMVGHNIKFDISWMRRCYETGHDFNEYMSHCYVWDTQVAEYILSGQRSKFNKLNDVAEELLGTSKIDLPMEAPDGAARYGEKELLHYLERDLQLTEEIALEQMAEATDEQWNLIIQMGETLKALEQMESNGMAVDEALLIDRLAHVGIEQHRTKVRLHDYIDNEDLLKDKDEWYNSSQFLSCLIFGGTVDYIKKEENGLFKSGKRKGQVRYKNVPMKQHFDGFVIPNAVDAQKGKKKTKAGDIIYSVDEDTLSAIKNTVIMKGSDVAMIDDCIRMRELKKVAGTYYENLADMAIDGVVHHNLNTTATATGRLSSSNPNLQNVPMPDEDPLLNVKEAFVSYYGKDGVILEVDFKQLEVCALAWLTKDRQLIEDIRKGLDIHSTLAKQLGMDGSDKRIRRDVKTIVFAMIYGSGWKGICKSSGLPEKLVKDVIQAFYHRYTQVKPFYEELTELIEKTPRYDILSRDKDGNPCPMFEWQSPTGRKYLFQQDPYRPGPKYTQTRNYPVQGTATGDIVPVVISEIADVLRNTRKGIKKNVRMVTTTHDSVTFDCKNEEVMKELISKLEVGVFSDLNEVINRRLPTIEWDIPLVVEYDVGPNWGELKPLDKSEL